MEIPNKSLASPSFSIQPSFQPGNYGYVEAPFSIIRSFAIYPVRASRFPTARNNARNNPRLEGERNRLSSLDVSFFWGNYVTRTRLSRDVRSADDGRKKMLVREWSWSSPPLLSLSPSFSLPVPLRRVARSRERDKRTRSRVSFRHNSRA